MAWWWKWTGVDFRARWHAATLQRAGPAIESAWPGGARNGNTVGKTTYKLLE
jgi:hypothetical protein